MTILEIINTRYGFEDLIQKMNEKLEKANRSIDIEREYVRETPSRMSLSMLKLTYSRKKNLKLIEKYLKKPKKHAYESIKLVKQLCENANDFGGTIKAMVACINCYEEIYSNFKSIENMFDDIINTQTDGFKEGVDYLEDINSIIKQHYTDMLSLKKSADKILEENEERISLNITHHLDDFEE